MKTQNAKKLQFALGWMLGLMIVFALHATVRAGGGFLPVFIDQNALAVHHHTISSPINWNPSLQVAPGSETFTAQVPGENALTFERTLPQEAIEGVYRPGMILEGWTKEGVIMTDFDKWVAEYGNNPDYIALDMGTNRLEWMIFKREPEAIVQQQIINFDLPEIDLRNADLDRMYGKFDIEIELPEELIREIEAAKLDLVASEAAKQAENPANGPEMAAWPNPTTGPLTVRVSQFDDPTLQIVVMDTRGQVVRSAAAEGLETHVDLRGLAVGTYLVTARTAHQVLGTARVVLVQ